MLHYSQSFAWKLVTYPYKVQLLQGLKPEDKPRQKEFAVTMLDRLDSDSGFLKHVALVTSQCFTFPDY